MDTQQIEPVSAPLSLNLSYSVWNPTMEESATQGLPVAENGIPKDETAAVQEAINARLVQDPAEFELLIALRIRHVRWIFEIPRIHAPRITRLLASIQQRLPTIELPSQYSTVEAVTLFIAVAGIFTLYSLLDSRSPVFQAKQEDFVPFKYIDRSNAGPDIQPYLDGLRPYAAISLQILGPLLSLAISQGWLISTAKFANTALQNNNSTNSASRKEESNDIASTAGELLVKLVRVWLRAD